MSEKNAYQQAVTELEELAGPRFVRFTVSGRDAEVGQENQPTVVFVDGVGSASGKTLSEAVAAAKRLVTGEPEKAPAAAKSPLTK